MKLKYHIHPKEKIYFGVLAIISSLFYTALCYTYVYKLINPLFIKVFCKYFICSILIIYVVMLRLIGRIRGNAVKVSTKQFPELFELVNSQSKALELNKVPNVYIIQKGGFINAFASRFMRKYYVVLFAPILEEAYKEGKETLAFIVGHELGHIKRNHLGALKNLFILPSIFFFYPLWLAYSKAREYTCDRIGYALSPSGALKGFGLLAVGPQLYGKLDIEDWLLSGEQDAGLATSVDEFFSTHPHLVQRVKALKIVQKEHLSQKSRIA